MNETRCLSTDELLTEAWVFFRAAKDTGDMAGEAMWLEAIDALLDRPDARRGR
jgi:hypothetical protein